MALRAASSSQDPQGKVWDRRLSSVEDFSDAVPDNIGYSVSSMLDSGDSLYSASALACQLPFSLESQTHLQNADPTASGQSSVPGLYKFLPLVQQKAVERQVLLVVAGDKKV